MKKYYIFAALLIGATLFYACDEDTQEAIANPQDQVPAMSATINGTEWTADGFAGVDTAGIITIAGTNTGENSTITISFSKGLEEKSYDLGDTTSGVSAFYSALTFPSFASSGNVTVSNYNTTLNLVTGTFNFESDSTLLTPTPNSITNGEFTNVKIISQ
jgi:hypothetical protein